jgi:twitching motility protein PilT
MAKEKNGLILVTGATGSGKSTSLAALLEKINEEQSVHIITLEDPVEYQHTHRKATFNQRELGADFDSFANGLRAASAGAEGHPPRGNA